MARPSPLYLALGAISWLPVKLLYRLRATGLENVPRGGFVLAANHTSNFDPWPLALPLFPRRWLRFMAKSELYWWPLGHLLNGGGAYRYIPDPDTAFSLGVSWCGGDWCDTMHYDTLDALPAPIGDPYPSVD